MGVILDRRIEQLIREVESLLVLVGAINVSLTALEGRVKELENGDRQRPPARSYRRSTVE